MSEQEKFFSPNHKRLLNIAVWAKYLAWVVLIVYIAFVGIQILQLIQAKDDGNFLGQTSQSLSTLLEDNPVELLRRLVNMATALLIGIVYSVVLKGVSLGLNMIVETDINYRERGQKEDVQ